MNDLTPSFERETGQVILDGLSAGVAGEAALIPVPGLDLAFDRADGRLVRVVVNTTATDGCISADAQTAATLRNVMLSKLFGAHAPSALANPAGASALSPNPEFADPLSSLARLDAARATSPVPPGSPWWAAEAAELAERAGLSTRAGTEARHALAKLLGQLDGGNDAALPEPAIQAALAVAALTAADEPVAAARLRDAMRGQPRVLPPVSEFDVAAEVESLEKDRVRLGSLHWMFDPDLVPEGLFRPGLSPYSDLSVSNESADGAVVVEAVLAPGADCGALDRCLARLVDPDVRRVLAQAAFTKTAPDRVQANLNLRSRSTNYPRAGSRWCRTSCGRSAAPRVTGSGAPCAGPTRPCAPNAPRPDLPRTPGPKTGPSWPPRPGTGAATTGRPPAMPTALARPPGGGPLPRRRSRAPSI